MDVEAHKNLDNGQTSDRRSFDSNIYPSSQSRKVSIGVMVDPVANTRNGATKGNGINMRNNERVISNVGKFTVQKSKVEGVMASFSMKQTGPEEVKCSRITKSFYQRTPNCETILQANQTSNLLVSTRIQDKPDGVEGALAKYSVQLFSNQTSIFHSSDFNQTTFDGSTSKRKGRKEGTTGRIEDEFTLTAAKEVFKSDKTKLEDKGNETEKRTENLKMKLREILATNSSPKTRHSGCQTRNMDEESVLPERRFDQEDDKFAKTRQNSDTIETDSENPDHINKRPVTRSWSRKRSSAKLQPTKNRNGLASRDKRRHQGKDIFSFEEKWTGRKNVLDGGSLSKKNQRKNSLQICFYENEKAEKLCQENSKTDILPCDRETFSLKRQMGGFYGFLPDHHKEHPQTQKMIQENPQTQKIIQEKELCESPILNRIDKNGGLQGSPNGNQQEDRSNQVTENVADPPDNVHSPTFGIRKPTLRSSPGSTPETDVKVNCVSSPTAMERRFSLGIIRNLRNFQTLKPDCNRKRAQKQSSNMDELENSLPRKAASFLEYGLSDSSCEERKSQGSQEGLRDRQTDDEETFMLHPIKRLRSHEGIRFNDSSPPSLSSNGITSHWAEASDWIHEASEQTQDGFVRTVELFAVELRKIKNKLRSVASKKSSEILMSAAEEIHLRLKNVQSQIQEDIGKLTSLGESKRKRLETRFEDQQKQLRLIHEKFKEEINLHIQNCRNSIEGLEAERTEIKGALEKRRASHRKLLSQVEEGVEIQLNDAQRKIKAIQELARKKLLQLKHVIAMCLNDGILN